MSYPQNRKQRPILARFEDKYIPEPNSGCWLWIGGKTSMGYGQIGLGRRDEGDILAHRFSYEHYRGSIPDGFDLDHLCRNPACVNPGHLEAVTHQVTGARGNAGKYERKSRVPDCHPDRKHHGNGLCNACRLRLRRSAA